MQHLKPLFSMHLAIRWAKLFPIVLIALFLSRCDSSQQDDPAPDDKDNTQNLVKTKYKLEGLDDDFFKEFEEYTYFDIDTTSEGDTAAYFYSNELSDGEFRYALYFDEAFEPREYVYGMDEPDHLSLGRIDLDSHTYLIDSGSLKISAIKNGVITASIDVTGTDGIRGKTALKRYHLTSDRIVATSKEYF